MERPDEIIEPIVKMAVEVYHEGQNERFSKQGNYNPMTMSNPTAQREENDFYATDPQAVAAFLDRLDRDRIKLERVWECACGKGHISKVLEERGIDVCSSDLIDRGYGLGGVNFLNCRHPKEWEGNYNIRQEHPNFKDIVSNPPFKYAEEFVRRALELAPEGGYIIFLMRIQFLESKRRKKLFEEYPPKYVYVNSERIKVEKNGEFDKYNAKTQCFAWFMWQKGYKNEPIIRLI